MDIRRVDSLVIAQLILSQRASRDEAQVLDASDHLSAHGDWIDQARGHKVRRQIAEPGLAALNRTDHRGLMIAQARPGYGPRPTEAMPIVASRWTLPVRMVTTIRLSQLDEESAFSCGADPSFGSGFAPVGSIEGFQPFGTAADCERFIWDSRFGQGAAAKNPEVVLIQFRALSRNIAALVPGMGKGGVL